MGGWAHPAHICAAKHGLLFLRESMNSCLIRPPAHHECAAKPSKRL